MEYTFVSINGVIRPAFGVSVKDLQEEVKRRGKEESIPEQLHLHLHLMTGPPPLWRDFYGPNAGKTKHSGYLLNKNYENDLVGKTLGSIFRSHDLLSLALAEGQLFEPRTYIALASSADVEVRTPFERGGTSD